jgi:hypothetical protein
MEDEQVPPDFPEILIIALYVLFKVFIRQGAYGHEIGHDFPQEKARFPAGLLFPPDSLHGQRIKAIGSVGGQGNRTPEAGFVPGGCARRLKAQGGSAPGGDEGLGVDLQAPERFRRTHDDRHRDRLAGPRPGLIDPDFDGERPNGLRTGIGRFPAGGA